MQEIGVRMALGAQIRDVLRLVVVEGMRPTLLGIVLGLLAGVALLASAGPAWRAARVSPSEALQE